MLQKLPHTVFTQQLHNSKVISGRHEEVLETPNSVQSQHNKLLILSLKLGSAKKSKQH